MEGGVINYLKIKGTEYRQLDTCKCLNTLKILYCARKKFLKKIKCCPVRFVNKLFVFLNRGGLGGGIPEFYLKFWWPLFLAMKFTFLAVQDSSIGDIVTH